MTPYLFLDIDGVLATSHQYYTNRKNWPEYGAYRYDDKCVKVFNEILKKTDPIIILSSDWKDKYSINAMNNIFQVNNIDSFITDYTASSWGVIFESVQQLEECRAYEILEYVKKHKIEHWIAIDDLDLSPWISEEHFVRTPRANEGIKQSGIKNKILKVLHYEQE